MIEHGLSFLKARMWPSELTEDTADFPFADDVNPCQVQSVALLPTISDVLGEVCRHVERSSLTASQAAMKAGHAITVPCRTPPPFFLFS